MIHLQNLSLIIHMKVLDRPQRKHCFECLMQHEVRGYGLPLWSVRDLSLVWPCVLIYSD